MTKHTLVRVTNLFSLFLPIPAVGTVHNIIKIPRYCVILYIITTKCIHDIHTSCIIRV